MSTGTAADQKRSEAIASIREIGGKLEFRVVSSPTPRWKRLTDILVSLILLFLAAPILISIALYIKLVSRGV